MCIGEIRDRLSLVKALVGYVRVSTVAGREDERFASPDLQEQAIRAAASREFPDHHWVNWYTDLDQTGTTQDRPGLTAAIRDAQQASAVLWIYNVSRFARSVAGGLADLNRLREAGVEVASASERLGGDSAQERFVVTMMLALAELEVGQRAESWQAVIATHKEHGRWHGVVPIGYRRACSSDNANGGPVVRPGVIEPDPETAPLIAELFQRAADGESTADLGRWGIEVGLWRRNTTALDVLRNRVYVGEIKVPAGRRVPRVKRDGDVARDKYGRVRYTYTEHAWTDGLHDPLVHLKVFEAVQSRLAANYRPRGEYAVWWGTGRVRCALCESALYRDKGKYLRCQNGGADGCGWSGAPKRVLVEQRMLDALGEALAEAVAVPEPTEGDPLADAQQALDAARSNLALGMADAIRAGLKEAERAELASELRRDVSEAEAAVARLRSRQATAALPPDALESLGTQLLSAWPSLEEGTRREALAALDVTVLVDGAGMVTVRAPWRRPELVDQTLHR